MLRTDFPDIWATVVAGTADTVICVPQVSKREGEREGGGGWVGWAGLAWYNLLSDGVVYDSVLMRVRRLVVFSPTWGGVKWRGVSTNVGCVSFFSFRDGIASGQV